MKRKPKKIMIVSVIILCLAMLFIMTKPKLKNTKDIMADVTKQSVDDVKKYAQNKNLKIELEYEYNSEIEKDKVISQSIKPGTEIEDNKTLIIKVSKGNIPKEEYQKNKINELGKVPIMMYHGIITKKDSDTKYTLGNVDKDGYNRTVESFRRDLEFYYQNNYRMIRLTDYIDGKIDVEFGKSPIILTFDDGREDNFKVLGKKNGKLEIDPNCAVGVLEEFKKKYPDFNVTATFFINEELFGQKEYNEEIIKWLIENGYDIGNHTLTHVDFTKINIDKTNQEVGGMYAVLETVIKDKYVNIVALPFGSPYKKTHANFDAIINSKYQEKNYKTKAALRVGWEAEISCFDKNFDPVFLKRIRAYDNEGKEFDIKMNFDLLEKTRYISDGDVNTIVIKESNLENLKETTKKIVTY